MDFSQKSWEFFPKIASFGFGYLRFISCYCVIDFMYKMLNAR